MLPSCIEFGNGNGSSIYLPGATITGSVGFAVSKTMEVSSMEMTFCGEAVANWKGHPSVACVHELYSETINLDLPSHTVEPGRYHLPFTFTLPNDIPPTYKGTLGYVSHYAEVRLTRPDRNDVIEMKEITVLNKCDVATKPVTYSESGTLKGAIMRSGAVRFKATMSSRGVNSGQLASLNITVKNDTRRFIEKLKIRLVQFNHVHASIQTTLCNNGMECTADQRNALKCFRKYPDFEIVLHSGDEKEYLVQLLIPENLTPSFQSPLITVSYFFQFVFKTAGRWFAHSTRFIVPIGIGRDVVDPEEEEDEDEPIVFSLCQKLRVLSTKAEP